MARFLASLPRWSFLALMWVGSALITAASLVYLDVETYPPFVIEKLPVRFETLWLTSLRIHVAAACLSFPLCLLSMTRWLQRRVFWHRFIGRVTGALVLLALVPTGVVLAFDAKGGQGVTAGFLLSAAIVAVGVVQGVRHARRHDLVSHRRAMGHVVAQMSVAVTSRAMLVGMDTLGFDPDVAYVAALWIPVLGSAAIAERASLRRLASRLQLRPVPLLRKVRHALTSPQLLALVRPRPLLAPVGRPGR